MPDRMGGGITRRWKHVAIPRQMPERWRRSKALRLLLAIWKSIDLVFAPRFFIRQFILVTILEAGRLLLSATVRLLCSSPAFGRLLTGRRVYNLKRACDASNTYREWYSAAQQLDIERGRSKWRDDNNCSYFDEGHVCNRISLYNRLVYEHDISTLMFHLRSELQRDNWGIGNRPELFSHTLVGTKRILEEQQHAVIAGLRCAHTHVQESTPPPTSS